MRVAWGMKKLPPSGYISADDTLKPGYLARRMKEYRDMVKAQKAKDEAIRAEVAQKVKRIKP